MVKVRLLYSPPSSILKGHEVVIKNPADFVGSALGQSEANTKAILANTVGKVLIIDEVRHPRLCLHCAHSHFYLGLYAIHKLRCSRWSCGSLQNRCNRYHRRRSPECSRRGSLCSTLRIQGPNGRNVPGGDEIVSQPWYTHSLLSRTLILGSLGDSASTMLSTSTIIQTRNSWRLSTGS